MVLRRILTSLALIVFLVAGVVSLFAAENSFRSQASIDLHLRGQQSLQLPSVAQPVKVFGQKAFPDGATIQSAPLDKGQIETFFEFSVCSWVNMPQMGMSLGRGPPLS